MFIKTRRITALEVIFTVVGMSSSVAFAQSISYADTFVPDSLAGKKIIKYNQVKEGEYDLEKCAKTLNKVNKYMKSPIEEKDKTQFKEKDNATFRGTEDKTAISEIELKTGAVLVNRGVKKYRGEESTPRLIKGKEAAKKLIEHLKNLDMLPEEGTYKVVATGGERMSVHREDNTVESYDKFTSARIGRVLGGLDVIGDSRIVGVLAEDGDLQSFIYSWTPVEEVEVNNEEVYGDSYVSEKITERLVKATKGVEEVHAESAKLVLYDDGNGIIEPAIYVIAKRKHQNMPEDEVEDFFVPILKNSRAEFPTGTNEDWSMPAPSMGNNVK